MGIGSTHMPRYGSAGRWILAGLLVGLLTFQLPAQAMCVAPQLVTPGIVQPGDTIHVRGEYFAAECNDTSVGCVGPRRSPPSRGILVELLRDEEVIASTTTDANGMYEFEVDLPLPADIGEIATLTVVATTQNALVSRIESDPITVARE